MDFAILVAALTCIAPVLAVSPPLADFLAVSSEDEACDAQGVEFLQREKKVQAKSLEQEEFDCTSYPELCQEPFNCDKVDLSSIQLSANSDGTPNLQTWCLAPHYHAFVGQCIIEKDLVKAGHTQYDNTKAGVFGKTTYDLDGSYCFIEGHCLNKAVTNSTTLGEATQQCDDRYGHEVWTQMGSPKSSEPLSFVANMPNIGSSEQGFEGQAQTRGFLLLACIMGNYHCDVVYCIETYCKDPEMNRKYGHFLEDLGWTESTEPWLVGYSS